MEVGREGGSVLTWLDFVRAHGLPARGNGHLAELPLKQAAGIDSEGLTSCGSDRFQSRMGLAREFQFEAHVAGFLLPRPEILEALLVGDGTTGLGLAGRTSGEFLDPGGRPLG